MEKFLVEIVHLRARACWVLHYFSDAKYRNEPVLAETFRLTVKCLLTSKGDAAKKYLTPQIKEITLELLKIIRETENDDLTSVMQKIVCTYTEQLVPVAVDICQHIVGTFAQVLESCYAGDEKTITAMGLLNTMESILAVMESRTEVHVAVEPIILQAIHHIFTNSIIEFYEEAMSLSCDLTTKHIGADMYNMAKTMFEGDPGEDPGCHAAKLLEVILLQCKGHNIDQVIPVFVELVFSRLTKEIKTSEFRAMLLQVIIAAMYYNPELLLATMEKMPIPGGTGSVMAHFIQLWIHDTDCIISLHDRKICVLGLCHLMQETQDYGYEVL